MSIDFNEVCPQDLSDVLDLKTFATLEKIGKLPNNNKILERCPLCSSDKINFLVDKYTFHINKCSSCQLLFSNPYPTGEQLNMWYNSERKKLENEFFLHTFAARVKIFYQRIEIIQNYKTSGKLLDIGPSIGFFIQALSDKKVSFDITCCELSEVCCIELKKKYPKVKIENCDFNDMGEEIKFDIITLWDTVEHLIDLNTTFEKFYRLLSKDGIVVFSTPNTCSFEWICAGTEHMQLRPPAHINLLNQNAINVLLKNNGFEKVEDQTPNASIDISYIKSLIETNKIEPSKIGNFLMRSLRDKDFTEQLEKYLIEKRMGGNIVTVARKVEV